MERKLATVLFVDLVDSTGFVAGSDPEVVRRRVTRFFERVSHCVTTHGGIVEKVAGDAVMAAVGIPQAHEDDAERAVRAARLQQAAEPGEILIGPGAHRLTLGRIEVEDAGPLELKGRTDPLWAWRAIR